MTLGCVLLTGVGISADESEFRALFNGRDLTGWHVVNTAPSTWSFNEEGYLVCSGKPIGEIRTEKMYQNFILEAEWRHLVPGGNAGIFVWADDITARGQPFIRGVEVQVLDTAYGESKGHSTHGDIFPIHGASMTPENGRGGSRAFPVKNRSRPSPEWNHYRIECRDGTVTLAVNGEVVTTGRDCIPRRGYLCLESEGGLVHWRNVRIQELPDTPIDPGHIAIADRGYRSLYNGVDFNGWQTVEGWTSRDWEIVNKAGAGALTCGQSIVGDFGFIIDLQTGPESGTPHLSIRGKHIAIDPANPLLEKQGKYNRIEGSVVGDTLSLQINGKDAGSYPEIPTEGKFALVPDGPATWANPYLRGLPTENL